MTYILTKSLRIEAAHTLPNHQGKCSRLHGHSFLVTVEIQAADIQASGPQAGMAMDYADIAAPLRDVSDEYLDHHYLNATTGLENPTSEALARWIFERLVPTLAPHLAAVTVAETCTCAATYRPTRSADL